MSLKYLWYLDVEVITQSGGEDGPVRLAVITGTNCYLPPDETEYAWRRAGGWISPALARFSWWSFVIFCRGKAMFLLWDWKPLTSSCRVLAVLQPGHSKPLQSWINQALMLCNHPTGMQQLDEKWAICRCWVGLPGGGLRRWRLSPLRCTRRWPQSSSGYSQCSLPDYLIKSKQIISPSTSCGYCSTRIQYMTAGPHTHTHSQW